MKIELFPISVIGFGIWSLFFGALGFISYGINGLLIASIIYLFAGIVGVIIGNFKNPLVSREQLSWMR